MGRQSTTHMELEFGLEINRLAPKFIETDTMFIIVLHVSGVEKKEIDISINREETQISVICRGGGRCFCESVISGSFGLSWKLKIGHYHKAFWIPNGVMVDRIKARFDGVEENLFISMPKLVRGLTGVAIEEVQTEQEDGEEPVHESQQEASDNEQYNVKYVEMTSKEEISESDQQEFESEPESGASDHENLEDNYEEVNSTEEIPKRRDLEESIAEGRCDEEAVEKENECLDEFQDVDDRDEEEIPQLVEVEAKHIPQVGIEELSALNNDNGEEENLLDITRNKDFKENQGLQVSYPKEIKEENDANNDYQDQSQASEELRDDKGNNDGEEKIPKPQPSEEQEFARKVHNEEITFADSGKPMEEQKNCKEPTKSDNKLSKQEINVDEKQHLELQSSNAPKHEEDKPKSGDSHTNESSTPTPQDKPPGAIQNEVLKIPEQIASPTAVDNNDSPQGQGILALSPHLEVEPLQQTPIEEKPQAEEIEFPPSVVDLRIQNEERDEPQQTDFASSKIPDQQEPSRTSNEIQSKQVRLPEPRRSSSKGEDAELTDAKATVEETTNPVATAAATGEKKDDGFGGRTPAGGRKIIRRPFPGSTILIGTAFIMSMAVLLLQFRKKRRQ